MKQRAFTLVELLVTISILTVLSSIGLVAYSSARTSQRDYQRKKDLNEIIQALELYRTDMHYYPKSSEFILGTGALPLLGTSTTYLDPVPDDPRVSELGQHYCYRGLKSDGTTDCSDNSSSTNYCAKYVVCAKKEGNSSVEAPSACTNNTNGCICKSSNGDCNFGYSSN